MTDTTPRKAQKKLRSLDFSGTDSHMALVHKEQGGCASGANYKLVVKATSKFSDAFVTKASKIKVELDINEYLERFYHIYGVDNELLARTLGFTTAGMDKAAMEVKEQALEDTEPPEYPEWDSEPGDTDYEAYINSKLMSISVMKALHDAESQAEVLASLSETEYLVMLKDQAMLEKAFKKIDAAKLKNKPLTKATKSKTVVVEDTSNIASEVNKGVSIPITNKELKMTVESTVVEQEVEVVAKSAFVELEKSLGAQQVELQKALASIAAFELKEKEQIAKARKAQVLDAVKDEGKAQVLFKAVSGASDVDFAAVVKALGEMHKQVEQSELFIEKGASVETEAQVEVSPLERMLKAKFAPAK